MADVTLTLAETERTLIGVLLAEPRAIIPISGTLEARDFSEPLCASLYQTTLELARASKVPNIYTVSAALPSVGVETLIELQARASPALVSEVLALADIVRSESSYRNVATITREVAAAASNRPADLDGFVSASLQRLASATRNQIERASDLRAIGAAVDAYLAAPGLGGTPTGFRWLTDRIGGWQPGNIVAVIAPYKGRKSTMMRHMILAAARDGKSVGVYALEGSREGVFTDLWAMMATQILFNELPSEEFMAEAYLSGAHLKMERTPRQQDALTRARQELDSLAPQIHIADGRDGILDLARFTARLSRDLFLYNVDMICVDHLQLFKGSTRASFFEVHEAAVGTIQSFALTNGVTAVALSQMNESAISTLAMGGNYSAGAKGGAALPAAADYVLTTRYDGDKEPDILYLRLKHARHAATGEQAYIINPTSGLALMEHN